MSSPKKAKYWKIACAHLKKSDPVMKRLILEYPKGEMVSRGRAFPTLLRSIVGQQISVQAADAVWGRFERKYPDLSPAQLSRVRLPSLQSCGLSRQKSTYIKSLAEHFHKGQLNPRAWARKSDEELIAQLTDVKGIGVWTAEMFLMFHLLRPNVLPLDDIGLQRAVGIHYFDGGKATKEQIKDKAEAWTPYSSVATWYLWRSLDPVPVAY